MCNATCYGFGTCVDGRCYCQTDRYEPDGTWSVVAPEPTCQMDYISASGEVGFVGVVVLLVLFSAVLSGHLVGLARTRARHLTQVVAIALGTFGSLARLCDLCGIVSRDSRPG